MMQKYLKVIHECRHKQLVNIIHECRHTQLVKVVHECRYRAASQESKVMCSLIQTPVKGKNLDETSNVK